MVKKLSVCTHFYASLDAGEKTKKCLQAQVDAWNSLSETLKTYIEFIIIDDCSDILLPVDFSNLPVRYFRITSDIPWNLAGSRNLAALKVRSKWALFHDIDQVFDAEKLEKLIYNVIPQLDENDPKKLYKFPYVFGQKEMPPHPSIVLFNINYFWAMGGYDEDFCGNYGYEEVWFNHVWVKKFGPATVIDLPPLELESKTEGEIGASSTRHKGQVINYQKFLNKFNEFELNNYEVNFNEKIRFSYIEIPVCDQNRFLHRHTIE
jgi:hypothetical protein